MIVLGAAISMQWPYMYQNLHFQCITLSLVLCQSKISPFVQCFEQLESVTEFMP